MQLNLRRVKTAGVGLVLGWVMLVFGSPANAGWRHFIAGTERQKSPPVVLSEAEPIKPGDSWPTDQRFRWLIGDITIPETIGDQSVAGKAVGLQLSCGDGGEVWLEGALQCRFDNDHPALVLLTEKAVPGTEVRVMVQVYGKVQGGDRFDQANLVVIGGERVTQALGLKLDGTQLGGAVPNGLIGLSQGGGLSDYEPATARKLKEGGFKWFRMDNVFTPVVKKNDDGSTRYDWADFDRRLDFLSEMGADAVLAASYMPQPFDAVPNDERQSAPKDYAAWEELCFQAAKRALERGRRVAFWEVWNEVNTGWLKPGPEDTGTEEFRRLYSRALGREATDREVVRRFEAYCKLYRATARGVRRADPAAKVGGPALASGPFENDERGHCFHGKGFARGLMFWCDQEKLPLDFVSWHEYFQSPETIRSEAEAFRRYLEEVPALKATVRSLMITEWNEAWWQDRPQDHEVGAAWCANSVTRAFIPAGIDRPCFFYVKQGDMNFRGDYSLLMADNRPKASYNVAKIFNGLRGRWVPVAGGDDDVSAVAAWDAESRRLAVVLVNFRDRYALRRPMRLELDPLPDGLASGAWREWVVDGTHSNIWHDRDRAELEQVGGGQLTGKSMTFERVLAPNSVTLLEVVGRSASVE